MQIYRLYWSNMHEIYIKYALNMQIICHVHLYALNMQIYANNMQKIGIKYANI